MQLGDTVRIITAAPKKIIGRDKWTTGSKPTRGIVEYLSPYGWVLLMTLSNSGRKLYREGFWREELEAIYVEGEAARGRLR